MAEFQNLLLNGFAGQVVTVKEILKWVHSESLKYTEKNVKNALKLMESDGRVKFRNPTGKPIRRDTLGDNIVVRFREK